MKKFLTVIILFLLSTSAYSQNDGAGNTGLSFLKTGVGSRSLSMGEAVSSNAVDASSTYYNPAAIYLSKRPNVLFMHNESILGLRTEFLGAIFKTGRFGFGLNINTTSIDDIEVREIPGEPIDKFSSRFFSLGISTAYSVNPYLNIGVTGKFLYEKIYIENASGFALDFGAHYKVNDRISVGAAVSNIGSLSELNIESTNLPTLGRLGLTYSIPLKNINSVLMVSAEGFKVFDGGKVHLHSGAELVFKDLLSIRAGYQSGYENKYLTTGIGIHYSGFTLDYSFIPYKYSQGNSHTISVGKFF